MTDRKKEVGLFFILTVPYLALSIFLLLRDPPIWFDEAYFFDVAHNFIAHGTLTTDIFGNQIRGTAFYSYEYPVYPIFLSSWMRIVGESIVTMRLLSVGLGFAAIILFYRLLKKLSFPSWICNLGVLIFSLDSYFGYASRFARMEILIVLMLLISLNICLGTKKRYSIRTYLTLAFLTSCSILTHPMGIIVPLFITMYSIFLRKRRETIAILLIVVGTLILTVCIWFLALEGFSTRFLTQLLLQSQSKLQKLPYLFTNFFFITFLHRIGWVLDVLVLTIGSIRLLIKPNRFIAMLLLSLFISTCMAFLAREHTYLVYIRPFSILLLLFLVQEQTGKLWKIITRTLLVGTLFMLVGIQIEKIMTLRNYNYSRYTNQLSQSINAHSTLCLSGVNPDPYFGLLHNKNNLTLYEFIEFPLDDRIRKSFLDTCDYLLIDHVYSYTIPVLEKYVSQNNMNVIKVLGPQDSYIGLIELKPKKMRL